MRRTKVICEKEETVFARYMAPTWKQVFSKNDTHDKYDIGYCGCGTFKYTIPEDGNYKIITSTSTLNIYINGTVASKNDTSFEVMLNNGDVVLVKPYMALNSAGTKSITVNVSIYELIYEVE